MKANKKKSIVYDKKKSKRITSKCMLLDKAESSMGARTASKKQVAANIAEINDFDKRKTVGNSGEEIDRFARYFEEKKFAHQADKISNENDTCKKSKSKERKTEITFEDFEEIPEEIHGSTIEETIEEKIKDIKDKLETNNVLIVQGDTGCGKTTKLPKLLLSSYAKIVCTQPRRIAAISVAKKVANDLKCKLGSVVGYSVRFEDVSSPKTRLKYVTDGILIKQLHKKKPKNEAKIAGYDLIIIDEAHERTVNIDLLLGYIKMQLQCNKVATKVLIMSATLNTEILMKYFNCPMITIKHRAYPITHLYLKGYIENYLLACVQITFHILEREKTGDILVFLPGQDEIDNAYILLSSALESRQISILKLYSMMPLEDQDLIFKTTGRKVILSTNIAETSITIETVKFVVDCGLFKQKMHLIHTAINSLILSKISKAQAKQRAGRAGRTHPGVVYRIYTYSTYLNMEQTQAPEILRSRLHSLVLEMLSLGISNVRGFDYLDKPLDNCIKNALQYLFYVKAIDIKGRITVLGSRISQFPLDPELTVSLFAAKKLGCLNAVATIAPFLDYKTPFIDIKQDNQKFKAFKDARFTFQDPKGDFYTYINVFNSWKKNNFSIGFLKKNYLNIRTMQQILNIRKQLLNMFTFSSDTSSDIEKAFCRGFFMNVSKKNDNCYKTSFGDVACYLHSSDGLFESYPKYVIFFDIILHHKAYMHHCIEITQEDLQESANMCIID
ncbi:ATP-dependent RNA helicase dhx8 [Glugoides intestinalis]